jgi:N-methylhydantoinase A
MERIDRVGHRPYLIAIDTGGTFTDIVLLDRRNGRVWLEKVLTTPADPSVGSMEGFHQILDQAGVPPEEIEALVHSTTVATNAVIERKGAKTGLITTRGFKDLLEIGRENRYDIYDLYLEAPDPLVDRCFRREIDERIDRDGHVERALEAAETVKVLKSLQRKGIESVAVSFLHSFANPENEERVGQLLAEKFGSMYSSLSSKVVGEIREYERTSTVVADAYIKPIMVRYIGGLETALKDCGFKGRLFIMLSNGGIAPARQIAQDYPVRVIESGPAAGVHITRFQGELLGQRRGGEGMLSFDMGGTTAKACLVKEGVPAITHELEVARVHRFKKGSGLPLKISSIELIEVGAGGGSIARVDNMGLLKVGPDSSGADPGPCCYGRGGLDPTVTDADLVLGYLDPDFFLGGGMKLNLDRARRAMEDLSQKIGRTPLETAWGIHDVVNENMAAAIRVFSAEKGVDLRRFALVAFGGAGPVHAYSLALKLHVGWILCPYGAGVASAIGSLVAPPAVDFVHSYMSALDSLDWNGLNGIYREMEERGRTILNEAGIFGSDVVVTRSADMRYVGQGYEITVPVPFGDLSGSRQTLEKNFWDTYHSLYQRHLDGVKIEGVSWRVTVSGPGARFIPQYGHGGSTCGGK